VLLDEYFQDDDDVSSGDPQHRTYENQFIPAPTVHKNASIVVLTDIAASLKNIESNATVVTWLLSIVAVNSCLALVILLVPILFH